MAVVEEGYFRERLWSETYFREQQQAESSSHGHVCASRAGFFCLNLFSRQFFFGLNLCPRPFFVGNLFSRAACILRASVQRKRRQAWCDYPRAILPCFATTSLQVLRKPAAIRAGFRGSCDSWRRRWRWWKRATSENVCGVRNIFSRAAAGGKFVAWPCLRFKSRVFWSKPIFKTVFFGLNLCPRPFFV